MSVRINETDRIEWATGEERIRAGRGCGRPAPYQMWDVRWGWVRPAVEAGTVVNSKSNIMPKEQKL